MVDLATIRAAVAEANGRRDALADQLHQAGAELAAARRQRDRLRSSGADAADVAAADARVAALADTRRGVADSMIELRDGLADALDQQFGNDIELEGDVPLVLLPVRIEVRSTADQARLRVRIFPDAVHAESLDEGLTEIEVAAAKAYWTQVWTDGDPSAPWPALQRAVGNRRAPWVADALRPRNLDARPGEDPDFPPTAAPHPGPSVARTLPDRFMVRIEQDGADPITVHTRPIPDELPVGLTDVDQLDALAVDDQDLPPLDSSMRWLVDYDEAVKLGLAVTVPLPLPGQDVDRVLVYGVRAALDPADSTARIEQLLRSHRYTDGAEFLAQGTPTNNTDSVRAEWSRRTPPGPPLLVGAAALNAGANGAVTAAAFGIDGELVAGMANAGDGEQSRAGAFNTALWTTTWGDAIEMLTPAGRANGDKRLDTPTLDAIREHWVGHVRGRGPLPALRVGRQPYGVLPLVATDASYAPLRGDVAETKLVPFLRERRFLWEDAAGSVPTVMDGRSLDEVLPEILGTDAVLRGLRVRTAVSPDPVLMFAIANTVGALGGQLAQQQVSAALSLLAGVADDAIENNLLTAKKTRTLALPLVDASDTAFVKNLLQPVPAPAAHRSVLQVLLAHADAINRHQLDRLASPEALDGTLRAAIAETQTDVDRDVVAGGLMAVQRGALDDGIIADAAKHVEDRVGRFDARTLADRHPIPALAPPTAVQQLAGLQPAVGQLVGVAGMRLIGEVLRTARWRAAFQDALRTIAAIDSEAERRRLLSETLDCCSHRLDAWIVSAASRRLADLRASKPQGSFIGAYGMIEHVSLRTPEPAGLVDGREVLHDPGDGGYVHAPGLVHAATAGVLRSGRLTHRRGDPDNEALDIDLSSTRTRDALSLLDGMRQGQSLGALLGYRLERRLHDLSGPGGLELDRFIYVLRTLAPLRLGKLTESDRPAEESLAANNVVDGLRLLELAKASPATIAAKLVSGPDDQTHIVPPDAWQPPQVGEADAVMSAIAELERTHDAVADLLLAESVYQLVSGNPARAAAAMDAVGAGEAVPPEPEVVRMPRTGVPIQHRLAVVVADPPPAPVAGWNAAAPRALAEPRLEAWAQGALGDPAAVIVDGEDDHPLAGAGLCALDVLYDADGDSAGTSTLAARLAAAVPELGADLSSLSETWETAGMLRALLLSGRPLSGTDVGVPVPTDSIPNPVGRQPDAAEILDRAQVARDALAAAIAGAEPAAALMAFGVRRPPAGTHALDAGEQDAATAALVAEAGRRLAEADLLLARTVPAPPPAEPPRPGVIVELVAQALKVIFAGGFVAVPAVRPAPAGETDLWADAVGPGGVRAKPGADIRPWLLRAGAIRAATSAYGEALLGRDAQGSRPLLRVVQSPAAAYPTWVGLPFPDRRPPMEPIASMVAEIAGAVAGGAEPDLTGAVAGIVVDEWTEVVPRRLERHDPAAPDDPPELVDVTTTGLAVHANGPGARPPQAILLAMTPDGGDWSSERLVAVLDEAFALARIRGVTLDQIPFAGRFLPALYFRDWSLQGEPVLDWVKVSTTMDKANALTYLKVSQ